MFIVGLGTALPRHRYTQSECWETLRGSPRFHSLAPRSQAILRKVLTGANGIRTRHLSLENLDQAFDLQPDTLHARYLEHAPTLASQAAQRALDNAQVQARDIDAVLISSCTGYLCPGLTSYVAQNLGLRSNVLALDLVGQGCGAALPNLQTGEALVKSGRARRVLSVCVEICSAAMYLDDDPGVLISACLFGDGAGAAVLSLEGEGVLEWKAGGSLLDPGKRDRLRFEQRHGMLRNILSPEVPSLAAAAAGQVMADVLGAAGVAPGEVRGWILHPGGRDVLGAVGKRLRLAEHDLRWSASVLERCGNLSSASLFFVLETALGEASAPGYWWMSSFGAGFSCHGALLRLC